MIERCIVFFKKKFLSSGAKKFGAVARGYSHSWPGESRGGLDRGKQTLPEYPEVKREKNPFEEFSNSLQMFHYSCYF